MNNCLPAFADYRDRRFFGSLDGLRCVAILAVIWDHTGHGLDWLPAAARGHLGVDLFFVISGFLIVTLLLREKHKCGSVSLRAFYMRRALRIFPVYYFVLAIAAVLLLLLTPGSELSRTFFADLPYHLTYTSDAIKLPAMIGVTWSLAAEEQFYLLWPPIEKWFSRFAWIALGGVIIVNQGVNFGLLDGALTSWFGVNHHALPILQTTFTPICFGVLLARLLHSERGFAALSPILGHRAAPLLFAAGLAVLCNLPGELHGAPMLAIQAGMAMLIGSCVIREDHMLAPILRWGPARRIGAVSYGVYLYHVLVFVSANHLLEASGVHVPGLRFALCLVVTFVLAELSYRWLEAPLLRLKDRFNPMRAASAVPSRPEPALQPMPQPAMPNRHVLLHPPQPPVVVTVPRMEEVASAT